MRVTSLILVIICCTSELLDSSLYFVSWWDYLYRGLEDMSWFHTLLDYSILDSRLLLTVDILFYLRNLTDYTWYLPDNYLVHVTKIGKILLHGNNTRMFTCYMFLLYRYPVTWHVVLLLYRYPDFHMLLLLPWLPPSYPSDLSNMYIK